MKKIISILSLLVMVSSGASAQWYLFPLEKEKQKEQKKTEEKKTQPEATVPAKELEAPVTVSLETEDGFLQISENPEAEADSCEVYSLDIPEEINLAMLLPIRTTGKTSSNFLEMYAGGLLALRDLGREGLKVNLSIFDCADEEKLITGEVLERNDVIIGPVASEDILGILSRCSDRKRLVSPLDPKAESLADSCNVIQAPSSWKAQVDGLLDWVREEFVPGDDLVLVKDTAETAFSEQTLYLLSKLEESGLKYKTSYLASGVTPSAIGTTRYLVASDRDGYIATAVRQIGLAAVRNKAGSSCVYLTSKMRNAKGVDQQYLYKAGAKVSMSYFTDYDDQAVKDFILSYRALFKDEPASFAFQGYDTVKYFAEACSKYGRQWYMKLPEAGLYKGLQSNFEFHETDGTGQANKAVKRVIYNPDMSTTIQ